MKFSGAIWFKFAKQHISKIPFVCTCETGMKVTDGRKMGINFPIFVTDFYIPCHRLYFYTLMSTFTLLQNQTILMKDFKCLLIDDDKDDQEIFNLALDELTENVDCVFANDCKQGLDVLSLDSQYVPDIIFIDLNMPKVNGKICLAKIKALEHLNQVPIIIYTTSESEIDKQETFSLGARTFITKPSTVGELALMLSAIFINLK